MDPFIVVLLIFLAAGTLAFMFWGMIGSLFGNSLDIEGDNEEWS